MPHPDDQTLRLFLDARLETEQEEQIEEHLEQCPICKERVTQLERSRKDPLLRGLKGIDLKNSGDDSEDESDDHFELPTEPLPVLSDTVIGNYTILGLLGSGGMGTVYRGVNPHLNRPAAIKVIKASRALRPSSAERFQRELLAIGKLRHPNIVDAFDAGVYEDRPYLAMELLEGDDLAHYVKEHGPLPIKEACDIIRQAALGLQHAHEAGLVHRDIKPSNLFRTKDGTIKILDLGLARLLETESIESNAEDNNPSSSPDATTEGQILGSPDYMSPEQAVNAKSVDVRSDLYSLGCTFFYLLTGTPPFGESTHPELADKIKAHSKQELPPLEQFRKDVPPAIRNLLYRMVAKRQEDRQQSAKEVITVLEQFLRPAWKRYAALAVIPLLFLVALGIYGFVQPKPEPIVLPPERVEVPIEVPVEKLPDLTFDWKPVRTITTGISPKNSAFFTADGNGIIETRSDGGVFLHDVATGKQLLVFEQVNSPLNTVAMSWDRTLLVGGCQNGFVHIWSIMSGKLVEGFRFSDDPIISIALSMDSSRLFMATNRHARVWRITDGETFKAMERSCRTIPLSGRNTEELGPQKPRHGGEKCQTRQKRKSTRLSIGRNITKPSSIEATSRSGFRKR